MTTSAIPVPMPMMLLLSRTAPAARNDHHRVRRACVDAHGQRPRRVVWLLSHIVADHSGRFHSQLGRVSI